MLDHIGKDDCSTQDFFFDVQYYANESHKKIKAQAETVAEVMGEICRALESMIEPGRNLIQNIENSEHRWPEDQEIKVVSNFLAVEERLLEIRTEFLDREDSAVRDSDLFGRNEARVVDGYLDGVKCVEALVDVVQGIRWAVMESAEGVEEIVRSESVEDFLASLK